MPSSDYAVGVFEYQKMIYIFSHYACVLLLSQHSINFEYCHSLTDTYTVVGIINRLLETDNYCCAEFQLVV